MPEPDWQRLRQGIGNLDSRELRDLAQELGWEHVRTSGGHHVLRKAGQPRPLVIPEHITSGTARGVLTYLRAAWEDERGDEA